MAGQIFNKALDEITKADIDGLILRGEPEGKNLDYKWELSLGSDGEKKEFLKDVASFANAHGGYIIFGIKEKLDAKGKKTGQPEIADGIDNLTDQVLITIADIIREGIDPRIQGVATRQVPGFAKGPVLIVYIPKSWSAPHMLYFHKNESRFWSRHSNGKFPLDVDEIRAAFALSESIIQRMNDFRNERTDKVIRGKYPIRLNAHSILLLHVLPVGAFDQWNVVDLSAHALQRYDVSSARRFDVRRTQKGRFNLDGYLKHVEEVEATGQMGIPSYVQFFRKGAAEYVTSLDNPLSKTLPENFGKFVSSECRRLLMVLKEMGVQPPLFASMVLSSVNGWQLYPPAEGMTTAAGSQYPFDRHPLVLPETMIENFEIPEIDLIRPTLDALWQAGGWSNYFEL